MDFHCRVILLLVNKIEAMYERPRVNVKIERGSTFTFTRDLLYIASILFALVKFTCGNIVMHLERDERSALWVDEYGHGGSRGGSTKTSSSMVSFLIFRFLFSVRRTWSSSF